MIQVYKHFYFVNYFLFFQNDNEAAAIRKAPNMIRIILCGMAEAISAPGIAPTQAQKDKKMHSV